MARLLTVGFEFGQLVEHNGSYVENYASSQIVTNPVRTGNYAWRVEVTGQAYENYAYFSHFFDAHRGELYARLALYLEPLNTFPAARQSVLAFCDGSTVHCALGIQADTQKLAFAVGGSGEMGQYGGTVYTGSRTLTGGRWYVVEVRVVFHQTNGLVEVKLNGVTEIAQSGIPTAVTANGCNAVRVGGSGLQNFEGFTFVLDDIAVNDTAGAYENGWPGQGGVYLLQPNQDVVVEWQTSDGGPTHWALVDEVPPGTVDWVYERTAGLREIFAFTDLPPEVQAVRLVQVCHYSALAQAGAASLVDVIRLGTVDYQGATVTLTNVAPNYVLERGTVWYTRPDGTAAWSPADVNALQAGLMIV